MNYRIFCPDYYEILIQWNIFDYNKYRYKYNILYFRLIKKEGDAVAIDEVVLEIETDKTALPVMSPGNGKIVKLLVKDGQSVKSQQALFQVNEFNITQSITQLHLKQDYILNIHIIHLYKMKFS